MSDSATPWTGAYQVPPSMGFSRQEYWSGLPFLSPKGRTQYSIVERQEADILGLDRKQDRKGKKSTLNQDKALIRVNSGQ